ncbi:hypothetical protein SAMN02745165_01202 [Malonomonas rubra DSM 5091]|uniref:Lipid A 3-O-deacylase (PagL) n=1 Tax=Malonomonas rubra DSM 5091 TaxID=1122189 RepID=A0A1M6F9H9_MALRU|nr:hypothetical protein [Malonomonas rubra]SHI94404.1 hypothetical protein SAMN02745165_01202 [Malonomonas rubra DSM 5091]
MKPLCLYSLILLICFLLPASNSFSAGEKYALNLWGAKLTSNNWDDFFGKPHKLNYVDSKIFIVSLAKRLGKQHRRLNYEIEGQLGKHSGIQNHWEINGLGVARWEPFFWDRWIDTSMAFGLGLSYATEKPKVEILNEGSTEKWMIYWMMELAFDLPQHPQFALITRLHHRSEAYGLMAEEGGSNALAIGLKYRF